QELLVQQVAFDALVDGADEHLQVLAHIRILLAGQGTLEFAADGGDCLAVALVHVRAQVDDLTVVAGDAEETGELGRERRLGIEQLLRVGIAARDPGGRGGPGGGGAGVGGGGGLVGQGGAGQGQGKGKADQAALHGGLPMVPVGTASLGASGPISNPGQRHLTGARPGAPGVSPPGVRTKGQNKGSEQRVRTKGQNKGSRTKGQVATAWACSRVAANSKSGQRSTVSCRLTR